MAHAASQHSSRSSRVDPSELHVPVMLDRCLELLAPVAEAADAVIVDATLGLGGHTSALLAAHPDLTVIGLDRDREALELARRRLAQFGDRARFVHTVYDGIVEAVADAGHAVAEAVNAIVDAGTHADAGRLRTPLRMPRQVINEQIHKFRLTDAGK